MFRSNKQKLLRRDRAVVGTYFATRVPVYQYLFISCSMFSALNQDHDCQNWPSRSQDMSKFQNWPVTSFRTTLWLYREGDYHRI